MRLFYTLLLSSLFSSVFFTSASAKTIELVHDGSAYYASFYISYISGSPGSRSFEGKGEGWRTKVVLPNNAIGIVIRVETNKFLGIYSKACTSIAGTQGGTFTLSGFLHSESCSFVPTGSDSETTIVGIDLAQMDIILPNGNSQLFDAVAKRDANTLKQLIDAGTGHLDTKNRQGLSPLHQAVQMGDSTTVLTLLNAGANAHSLNNAGEDPLMLAISRRKQGVVRTFLAQGTSVSPAHLKKAVAARDQATVAAMLQTGAVQPDAVLAEAQAANNVQLISLATANGAAVTTQAFVASVQANRIPQAITYLDEPTSTIDVNEAMRVAVQKNNKQLVNAVLAKGGDPAAALAFGVKTKDEVLVNDAILMHSADPNPQLATVVQQRNASMLQLLLGGGADASTALALALPTKDSRLIETALTAGAAPTQEQMKTAGSTGDVALLKLLVTTGNGDASAALVGAVASSKWTAAEALLAAGAQPGDIIAKAAAANQLPVVKAALNAGADPQPGLSPAIQTGKRELIKTILQAGATTSDPALVNKVVDGKDASILSMLLSSGTPPDVGMPRAIATGQTEMVKLMLDNGAEATRSSYVEASAKTKNTTITKLLLDNGADANVALAAAVDVGSTEIVRLGLAAGADGTSARLVGASAKHNKPQLTEALLTAGAPVSAIVDPAIKANADKVLALAIAAGEDLSPEVYLRTAVSDNRTAIVPMLLNNGSDPQVTDGSDNTLLHLAAQNADASIVQALITAGVDVNAKNAAGDAALHLCLRRGKKFDAQLQTLIANGADVNLADGSGNLPRDIARGSKMKRLLKKAGAQKSR